MMLRLAGSLVLAALMTAPAAAQKRRAPTGQMAVFGPQAGVNFARFGGGDVGSVDSRTGIQVGMFAAFPLGKYFAISPAVAGSIVPGGAMRAMRSPTMATSP